MKYDKFSQKQIKAMLWWKMDRYRGFDAIVCDGSVRSGKTLSMTIGFILWSLENYQNQNFAICGKTIASIRRNIVMQLKLWLGGICEIVEHRSQNYIDISIRGKKNRYFIFGGRDESSYSLIQGMTLAGVLLDEVALMLNPSWIRLSPAVLCRGRSSGLTATQKTLTTGFTGSGLRKNMAKRTDFIFTLRWMTI